jgi:iron-sulfur cluster insertion protein|tara:strand:- start:1863 stop:2192 length:330 start_codon:yes stop_codon:yes gene_type:complete
MSLFEVTDNAKKQITYLCEKNNKAAVKLSVLGGGCAGFKYDWSFIDESQIQKDDEIISVDSGKFVVDGAGILFLAGTSIDYVEEAFGSSFQINNPSATSSCGCGESFGV